MFTLTVYTMITKENKYRVIKVFFFFSFIHKETDTVVHKAKSIVFITALKAVFFCPPLSQWCSLAPHAFLLYPIEKGVGER